MDPTCMTEVFEPRKHTRTFILRLWLEDLGEGKIEWRGRVLDVMNGQVCFFRGWECLTAAILEMLASRACDTGDASDDELPKYKR